MTRIKQTNTLNLYVPIDSLGYFSNILPPKRIPPDKNLLPSEESIEEIQISESIENIVPMDIETFNIKLMNKPSSISSRKGVENLKQVIKVSHHL